MGPTKACGAKTYQICDANPYIESLFPNGEVGLYHNEEELFSLISWALDENNKQERERHAEAAYQIISEKHTFLSRVREMLEKVGEI